MPASIRIRLTTGACAAVLASPAFGQTPGAGELSAATVHARQPDDGLRRRLSSPNMRRARALDIVQRIPGFTLDLGNNAGGERSRRPRICRDRGQRRAQRRSPELEVGDAARRCWRASPRAGSRRSRSGPGDLYGADYSSKTQVANLFLSADRGIAGNATVSAVRHWFGKIVPTASASILLSRGPSTFNLSGDLGRTDYFEEGFDRVTDFATGDLVEFRRKFNSIHPARSLSVGQLGAGAGRRQVAPRQRAVRAQHLLPACRTIT